jgi:CubicO group peptidase (beta-lactamase class C family)
MRNTLITFVLFSSVLLATEGYGQATRLQYGNLNSEQATYDDGIIIGNLSEAGLDSAAIGELTRLLINDSISNVHSLLIMKDNKLVYENYFAGEDQRHGRKLGVINHHIDLLHDCRSISKSIVSACIGIALKNGIIESIDDPVKKYFPEIKDSLKGTITIRNLLTMTSGLEWNEIGSYGHLFNSETQMSLRFNPVKYIFRKKLRSRPGTEWNYSGGSTQLLAEIIYRKSGLRIDEFADKYLFLPVGIHQYEWVNLTFRKIPAAASGLRLTSRDLLKFGLLYMNNGNWNGIQILDTTWVMQSFDTFIGRPDLSKYKLHEGGYGYQFWTYRDTLNERPIDIVEAKGNGGQSIFFCKSLNLVVVTTGGNYNRADNNPYLMLTKYILPAVQ